MTVYRFSQQKYFHLVSSSFPSLLNNPHHLFRTNNERLDWKILDVYSHKKCFIRLSKIFSYNFFAVNRFYNSSQCVLNNFSKIRFFFYQRRNKNVCINDCKNFQSLFPLSNREICASFHSISLNLIVNFLKAHYLAVRSFLLLF